MKSLSTFITENTACLVSNYINESNFHAEDVKLADLDPKLQDVAKFRLLVKKWDDLGEEIPIGYDEHYAGTTFERLEDKFDKDTDCPKEKDKVKEARKAFRNVPDGDDKEDIKAKIKIYGAYVDAFYTWAKKYATNGKGSNKWIDTGFIVMTFLGLGSWIINYGFKENIQDQLLGKLIKKFDKDMGKIRGVEGASEFLKLYDDKKISLQNALKIETATLNSIKNLEEERKNHKYTILGGFGEGQGEILFFDNSKFESFEDILESEPIKEDSRRCEHFKWTGYDANKLLRQVVNTKKIQACTLVSGYYTFNDKDKDSSIPKFGFYDETPEKIYKYYSKEKRFVYRGEVRNKDYGYFFFDSLWSQPVENK